FLVAVAPFRPPILRRTLPRIVRHIPPRTLKLNRWRRNRPFQLSPTMRTLFQMRPGNRLDLLRPPPTFLAFILVQWHCSLLESRLNPSVYHAPQFTLPPAYNTKYESPSSPLSSSGGSPHDHFFALSSALNSHAKLPPCKSLRPTPAAASTSWALRLAISRTLRSALSASSKSLTKSPARTRGTRKNSSRTTKSQSLL